MAQARKTREEIALELLNAVVSNPALTPALNMLPNDYLQVVFKITDDFIRTADETAPKATAFVDHA